MPIPGKRTVGNTLSRTADTKIQEYESKFKNLKDAFQGRAVLQTEITVSRILGIVDSLGTYINILLNICRTEFVYSSGKCS